MPFRNPRLLLSKSEKNESDNKDCSVLDASIRLLNSVAISFLRISPHIVR